MALIKCKMCGGDLVLTEGSSVAECEYCGSVQTVPTADNEKKLTLFGRAGRLRAACEFDKAAGVYETIVAEFPEEAEAYWGLVLCRYGIEYVDDPATGKKIPTCHRSGFDSVMEDADLEQALENADVVARRIYREEAKQIEELRKGIVAVSAKEEPYDIFICYKETAEDGDRTLDSVLAQDIYDALTDKGYRVFFARITLEDKLGVEYEPYIFAALNSAKIMLAVGTDFEYYNAVWVKNEWSRYLKLMASDKTKHLIPCYKGLDAYDMPKEFAKLQAQDLGKVGAMQDLLRGIEKILPKNEPAAIATSSPIFGGTGNVARILERGNMALEDGEWEKADSFFEDVLNSEPKNAAAYLGKALASEQCRTLDALVRKRKKWHMDFEPKTMYLEHDAARIGALIERHTASGILSEEAVRQFFAFDPSYQSDVEPLKQKKQEEELYWQEQKDLSRAERFASDVVAQAIRAAKQQLMTHLEELLTQAQLRDDEALAEARKQYEERIEGAGLQALYLEEYQRIYEQSCGILETSYMTSQLRIAAENFRKIGDFKDSPQKAQQCEERIRQILKKKNEESKKQQEQRHKQHQWQWRYEGKCQHCGGDFKGIFNKKCSKCDMEKDY